MNVLKWIGQGLLSVLALIGLALGFWVVVFLVFALIHVTLGEGAAKAFGNLFR